MVGQGENMAITNVFGRFSPSHPARGTRWDSRLRDSETTRSTNYRSPDFLAHSITLPLNATRTFLEFIFYRPRFSCCSLQIVRSNFKGSNIGTMIGATIVCLKMSFSGGTAHCESDNEGFSIGVYDERCQIYRNNFFVCADSRISN